jgi:hypothetical protein
MNNAMMCPFLIVMMLLVSVHSHAGQPLVNSKAPDFSLRDQRGNTVTLQSFAGKSVILLASDKEGMAQNPAWRKAIVDRYDKRIAVIGVADLRKVPFLLKGYIKSDFKKDSASIILDWDGAIFTSYGFAEHVANIVLIDGNGVVRYLHRGNAEPGAVKDLFAEADKLRE